MSLTSVLTDRFNQAVTDGNFEEARFYYSWLRQHEHDVSLPVSAASIDARIQGVFYNIANLDLEQATETVARIRSELPTYRDPLIDNIVDICEDIKNKITIIEEAEQREDFEAMRPAYEYLSSLNVVNARLRQRFARLESREKFVEIRRQFEQDHNVYSARNALGELRKNSAQFDDQFKEQIDEFEDKVSEQEQRISDAHSQADSLEKEGKPLAAVEELNKAIAALGAVDVLVKRKEAISNYADSFEEKVTTAHTCIEEERFDRANVLLREADRILGKTRRVSELREALEAKKKEKASTAGSQQNQQQQKTTGKETETTGLFNKPLVVYLLPLTAVGLILIGVVSIFLDTDYRDVSQGYESTEQAESISREFEVGGSVFDELTPDQEVEYTLYVPVRQNVTIYSSGPLDLLLDLRDSRGNSIALDDDSSIEDSYNFRVIRQLSGGNYTLRVMNMSSRSGPVGIHADNSNNPGLIPDNAGYLSPGGYSNRTIPNNQNVYYKIALDNDANIVLRSKSSRDLKATLYNSSMTQIDSDDDSGEGRNFRLSRRLSAGEYILKIEELTGASTSYWVYFEIR